ncbi:MAG: TetR/AcrR family transcriptional regulator [Candidatus Eisenbacteria bacterium]|uniref:TetR/AcrR family transcriptional regulator n=1 Tax=Eiseniibacteriota bacterium TaxID=2212470 RepID=A0A956RMM1_UNCEI|nr:TetR/AcrR family transcriptional regulator [Candidatus Eisenbacteria bacterium]
MSERRDELIRGGLDYLLAHGLADLSLRPLAAEIGTSARLLVYHFGSKEGLIAAIMSEVQTRLQDSFARLLTTHDRAPGQRLLPTFWDWTIRPENAGYLRLLFEVQILAIQDPDRYGKYAEESSSQWLDLIERSLPASKDRRALATLCAAVVDGLLLEFLSTGDRRRTTKALQIFDRSLVPPAKQPPGRKTTRGTKGKTR